MENLHNNHEPVLAANMPRSLIGDELGQRVFANLRQFNTAPSYSHELSADAQARLDRAYAILASPLTPEAIDENMPEAIVAPNPGLSPLGHLVAESMSSPAEDLVSKLNTDTN